jgi:photosystem II stability/assembly factor-like uncharacterized protein
MKRQELDSQIETSINYINAVRLLLTLAGLLSWFNCPVLARFASSADALSHNTPQSVNDWSSNGPAGQQVLALAIDPDNSSIIYAGTRDGGVFKSMDGGTSWQEAKHGLPRERITTLKIDLSNPDTLYAGVNGAGVFKSTDGGATWSAARLGMNYFDVRDLTIDPNDPATLFAAQVAFDIVDPGVYKSTDAGLSWHAANSNSDATSVLINPANSNIVYVGFNPAVVFKSADGGVSWDFASPNFSNTGNVADLVMDRGDPNTIYALVVSGDPRISEQLSYSAFKSADGSASWNRLGLDASALAIDPSNPNTLYAGAAGGVFRSTDGGASWSDFSPGLPAGLIIQALVIDPLGTSLHAGTQRGVFDFQLAMPCAEALSPALQSFDVGGGAGSVSITAGGECSWTATSYASWINITSVSSGSGNGTIGYSVDANSGTAPRTGTLNIAARLFTVSQAGLPVRISSASVEGKRLFVFGENFEPGAVILLNGEEQKTRNNDANPKTTLIGKKAGKKINPADKIQVRNPNGTVSQEFTFTGS